MKRRTFIQHTAFGAAALSTAPLETLTAFWDKDQLIRLTILHTNDTHSRIDPFPQDGGKFEGKGGVARRAKLVQQIRESEEHVLLLDAGDIFQGTPYFNLFEGELEIKLMSETGYDAATMGNHDFDAGVEGFLKQLPHANFPFVTANYDFSDTPLIGKTEPYTIFKKGPLKIGLFGLGVELDGLVPQPLYGNTRYKDPLPVARDIAGRLKHDLNCDAVICLSHLGYKYDSQKVSDTAIAREARDIDLIIGGHTHTFLDQPVWHENAEQRPVMINQVGWAGILLGRIDMIFERNKKGKCVHCENLMVG